MPQIIEVPNVGEFEFPDDFSDDQIRAALKDEIPRARKLSELYAQREGIGAEASRATPRNVLHRLGLGLGTEGAGQIKKQSGGLGEFGGESLEEGAARPSLSESGIPIADPASALSRLLRGGIAGISKLISGEAPKSIATAPAELAQRGERQVQEARELGEAVGGGRLGDLAQTFGSVATSSAPILPFIAVGGAVGGPAVAIGTGAGLSGLQQTGASYIDFRNQLVERGLSPVDAERKARGAAALSGLITAAVTRGFGATGLEAIGKGVTKGGFVQTGKAILRDLGFEGAEEATDQLLQGVFEKAAIDPEKPWSEIVAETIVAGGIGGALGGTVGAAREVIGRTADPIARGIENQVDRLIDALDQRQFNRLSELAADLEARQQLNPRTRAPRETVPPPTGQLTPEALATIQARAEADRAMMPPPSAPAMFAGPTVAPDIGFVPDPVPQPPSPPPPVVTPIVEAEKPQHRPPRPKPVKPSAPAPSTVEPTPPAVNSPAVTQTDQPGLTGGPADAGLPIPPPSDRWTVDRGAMPGEPSHFLDGDSETAVAAITEIDGGGFYISNKEGEVVQENGKPKLFDTLAEAAAVAESLFPPSLPSPSPAPTQPTEPAATPPGATPDQPPTSETQKRSSLDRTIDRLGVTEERFKEYPSFEQNRQIALTEAFGSELDALEARGIKRNAKVEDVNGNKGEVVAIEVSDKHELRVVVLFDDSSSRLSVNPKLLTALPSEPQKSPEPPPPAAAPTAAITELQIGDGLITIEKQKDGSKWDVGYARRNTGSYELLGSFRTKRAAQEFLGELAAQGQWKVFQTGNRVHLFDSGSGVLVSKPLTPDYWRILIQMANERNEALGVPFTPLDTANVDEIVRRAIRQYAGEEAESPAENPSQIIADFVKQRLKGGQGFSWQELFAIADRAYGGTQAQGKYSPKDAYDAMELGVNQFIRDSKVPNVGAPFWDPTDPDVGNAQETVKSLKLLIDRLPTQTKRTAEQDEFQQFSTPPPLGYAASWVANITPSDVVLEPSAGIGGLGVFPKTVGATVIANELSARRREVLRNMGFDQVFGENAEQIHNILPPDIRPTVVLMNPPFSATAGRLRGQRKTQFAVAHIEQALKRLAPGGRLVAIVGEGMALDRPTFRRWFDAIAKQYNIRANVGVSGAEYTKYGTSFGNQILVIDKTGPLTSWANVVTGSVTKIEDLIPLLERVRNARQTTTAAAAAAPAEPGAKPAEPTPGVPPPQSAPDQPAGSAVAGATQPTAGAERPARVPTDDVGPGSTAGGVRQPSGNRPVSGPGDRVASGKADEPPSPGQSSGQQPGRGTDQSSEAAGQSAGGSGSSTAAVPGQRGPDGPELAVTEQTATAAKLDATAVFENYQAQVKPAGAVPHPTALAESAAMRSVRYPPTTYRPTLPSEVITEGRISDAQFENVMLAGAAHQRTLPDGSRQGYFVGDGTGVGKGRTIAAIVWDNWNQGRKKAVWISKNSKLIQDARRDVEDLGYPGQVLKLPQKAKDPLQAKEGVLFVTYGTLKSEERNPTGQNQQRKTRLQQIVDWLGKDFDGVIVFDEAHALANAIDQRGNRGTKKASATALKGLELQRELPNARIVYVSATGATEVTNLAYAERLGLWGQDTPFPSVRDFISQIGAGGVAAMEVVAKDLKSMGLYMSRTLNFEGVTYRKLEQELTDKQRALYDELARAWQMVLHNIDEALGITGGAQNSQAKKNARGQFWGAHQRFFNGLLTSLQLPAVIASIRNDLNNGDSVVLQLVNTNESAQERAAADAIDNDEDLEDLEISGKDILIGFVEKSFPTQQYEETTDSNGNIVMRPVVDSQGNPVQNPDAVALKDELLNRLASLNVPQGVLDAIIEEFGSDVVAEVTGRSRRLVRGKDGRKDWEKRGDKAAKADIQAFRDDRKRILVFSDAGGTGASYHADKRYKNQRKRRHYVLQPGWRADNAIQGLGRSHRSNQAQPPEFVTVSTDLPGHKRFVSTIARRIEQLGAITKGQRQATSQGVFDARDNLESSYAREALRIFLRELAGNRVEGITGGQFQQETGLKIFDSNGNYVGDQIQIHSFLNRLLSLTVETQNLVFAAFSKRLDDVIEYHRSQGSLDVGMETLVALSTKKANEQVLHTDPNTGTQTKMVELDLEQPSRLQEWNDSWRNDGSRFVVNLKSNKIWKVSELKSRMQADGTLDRYYILSSPNNTYQRLAQDELKADRYRVAAIDEAKSLWDQAITELPKTYIEKVHLVTGTILPVWDRFPRVTRIARAQTDNGERLLGIVSLAADVPEIYRRFGLNLQQQISVSDAIDAILNRGAVAKLSNGWRILSRRVSGEERLEILGPELSHQDELRRKGVILERIGFTMRYFIPTGETAASVLESIVRTKPIVELLQSLRGQGGAQFMLESPGRGGNVPFEHAKPDAERDAAVDALRRILLTQPHGEGSPTTLRRVDPSGLSDSRFANRVGLGEGTRRLIERTFGREIIFIDTDANIGGVILDNLPQFIFLNVRTQNPWVTVIGHELMEHLRLDMPAEYEQLVGILREEMQNFPQYQKVFEWYERGASPDHVFKEFVADFAAYEFQRPEFWNAMAEREPSLFVRLGRAILRWLNGVIQKIRGFETDAFFRDVERVRGALADAMAKFAATSQSRIPPELSGEGGAAQFMVERAPFESRTQLQSFLARPGITPEQKAQMETAAGAQAGLVPDSIADSIRNLNSTDPIQSRVRSLLNFLIELRDLASIQQLQNILQSNEPDHVKDMAVSGVLRQIEHIKARRSEYQVNLEQALRRMQQATRRLTTLNRTKLVENVSRQMVDNLIQGYRIYLTAQAASLPADANVRAVFNEVSARMVKRLEMWEKTPSAVSTALEVIAQNVQSLPISQGPAEVAAYIRTSGMLNGKVGQDVIDLLTLPKQGGLPSAIEAAPDLMKDLQTLRDVQDRADEYDREIKAFERIFHLVSGTPASPVELRRWANEYRRWRNKQAAARKLVGEIESDIRQADEDIEVYSQSVQTLDALQQDPQFLAAYRLALDAANVVITDIQARDPVTGATIYKGPITEREYRIDLRPDRIYDDEALQQIENLLNEVDQLLADPNADPLLSRTWDLRAQYIRRYLYYPQFGATNRPEISIGGVKIKVSPFEWLRMLLGQRLRSAKTELEFMDYRGALNALREFQLGDIVSQQFRQLRNDKSVGFAAINNAVLEAVKSHGQTADWIQQWEMLIADPIIASQQTIGEIYLRVGSYINGFEVTREDLAAISLMKRFSNRALQIVQKAAVGTPLKFYNPLQIQDKFADLKVSRNAFGPGPLTMARLPSLWGESFAAEWSRLQTPQEKLALIADGLNFRMAVMGYVRETNPEFAHKSPFKGQYRRLADLAKDDINYNFTNLNELVAWLATETTRAGQFANLTDAQTAIPLQLVREIDGMVKAYLENVLKEPEVAPETGIPDPVLKMATARNSFTLPRSRLVAPSTFFSYSMAEDARRTFYLAGAYTAFQLRQARSLRDLLAALKQKQAEYERNIAEMQFGGTSRAKSIRAVQRASRAEAAAGQTRFDYKRLLEYIHVLEKIFNDLTELTADRPEAFDSAVLYSLSQNSSLVSSALLSSAQSIANNLTGGIMSVPFLLERNLGRASLLFTPIRASGEFVRRLMQSLTAAVGSNRYLSQVLNTRRHGFRKLADMISEQLIEQQRLYAEAYHVGLVNPGDVQGRLKAARELKLTGGRIDFNSSPALVNWTNYIESIPGIRWLLEHLKDKSPRLVDDFINITSLTMTRKNFFDRLKKEAITAFAARERLAAAGATPNDFRDEANLLKPEELGLKWHRDMVFHRQLFSSVGLMDEVLLNYYERWKAAPDADKPNVPLFATPEDEASVLFEVASKTNLTTPSNLPFFMQGVGYKGQLKRIVFMFQSYVTRISEQLDKLIATSQKDPEYKRKAHAVYAISSVLILMAIVGMLARELGQEGKELLTGQATSQLRLANVLNDPSLESVARYTGIALAANLPFYGETVSRLLGNPAYRSWWDITEMIPMAGLVKDAAQTSKRIVETENLLFPAGDFVSRWFPPAAPVMQVIPLLSGDIAARNATRALRATAPDDMELTGARQTGGYYRQTPVTGAVRELMSAAYRGDAAAVARAYGRAVEEKRLAGAADPDDAVWQSIQAQTPARKVFGRAMTPDEESRVMSRMSGSQRFDYEASKNAFALIGSTLGRTPPTSVRQAESRRPRFRSVGRTRFGRLRLRRSSRLPGLRRSRLRRQRRLRSRSRSFQI